MLKTAMIFGNHMTLQQEKPIKIWGTAQPGQKVTLKLSDCDCLTEAVTQEDIWKQAELSFLLQTERGLL